MKEKLEFELTADVKTPGASESTKQLTALYQVMDKINNAADKSSGNVFKMNVPNMSPMLDQLKARLNKGPVNTMYGPGSQSQMMSDLTDKVSTTNYADIANSITTASSSMESFKQKLDASNPAAKALNVTISDSAKRVLQLSYDYQKNANEIDENKRRQRGFNDELSKGSGLVKQLKNSFNALGMVQMVYLYRSVRRVTSGLVSMVENAANFEESMNLYAMSFGEYAEKANAWMDNITTKLKLDPSAVMQYAGAFNNLVKGMGVTSDAAYVMSTNLTQLTYDMASYLNISNEAAQAKIQSAMAGQSRAVASVGIAMQVASLQELAYSLNIKKKVSEMTQAEKTYLRYIQLLRSTTHMQGDLGKTMMTPANAIRVLKQQLNLLSRAIGQVLTPLIMEAIPYIIAFTNVLQKAARAVAEFFGYKYTDVGNDTYAVTFEDITDGLDGVGDSATQAGKKIKNSLAPFDELNQVMSESAGTGTGGFGTGGKDGVISDLEKYVSGYDMLSKYTGDLAKKAEGLEGTVQKILTAVGVLLGGKLLIDGVIKLAKLKTIIDDLGKTKLISSILNSSFGLKLTGILSTVASLLGIVGGGAVILDTNLRMQNDLITDIYEGIIAQEYGLKSELTWYEKLGKAFLDNFNPIWIDKGELALQAQENLINRQIGVVKANGDLFGSISISATEWSAALKDINSETDGFVSRQSTLQSTLEQLTTNFKEANDSVELYNIKFRAAGEITKDDGENVKKSVKDMCDATKSMIGEITDNTLVNWGLAFKNTSVITEEEEQKILKHVSTYGAEQEKAIDTAQNNITKTYDRAIKTRGYLTDEERKYIDEQLQKIRDITEQQMTKNQANIEYLKGKFADKNAKLDEQSYRDFQTALNGYYDEQKRTIEDRYYANLSEARRIYGEHSDEYNKMKAVFDEERRISEEQLDNKIKGYQDDVYKNLVDTYNKIKNQTDIDSLATKKIIEGILKDAKIDDTEFMKNITTKGETAGKKYQGGFLDGLKSGWSNVTTWIKNNLGIGSSSKGGSTGSHGFATGGVLENGDYFHMNERGNAEFLGSIGGQKAVVNQSQMVQSLAMVITGAMANMGFNGNQSGTVVVNIGNKKVYEGQGEYQNRENDRYGTTVVRV